MNGAANRPAETGGVLAGAVVALIVYFGGIDDPAIVPPLILVVGAVPGVITGIVGLFRRHANGGAR